MEVFDCIPLYDTKHSKTQQVLTEGCGYIMLQWSLLSLSLFFLLYVCSMFPVLLYVVRFLQVEMERNTTFCLWSKLKVGLNLSKNKTKQKHYLPFLEMSDKPFLVPLLYSPLASQGKYDPLATSFYLSLPVGQVLILYGTWVSQKW